MTTPSARVAPADEDSAGLEEARGVTIRDVAKAAEVSATTVSNLLNGRDGRMLPRTKSRILRAMKDLGYSPNLVARQLRTGRGSLIGLLVPSAANPFWGAFAHAVETRVVQGGEQVLLCNTERNPERERSYLEELSSLGVRSAIIGSSLPDLHHLDEALERGTRLIIVDREAQPDDPPGLISVSVDNELGARLATDHLIELGHRRIGFISGKIATVSRQRRLAGYQAALSAAGIELRPADVWAGVPDDFGDTEGSAAGAIGARELLQMSDPPTALVAINDMYALGASQAIRELGMSVPEISVVGFDDTVLAGLSNPPLTTVRQPVPEMADAVVDAISANRGEARMSRTIAPQLIVRQSTAPPRPSGKA